MNAIHALSQLSYVPENFKLLILNSESAKTEFTENIGKRQVFRGLFAFEFGLALFEKRRDAFGFVFGRKTDGEQIDFAAQAFVEI